MSLLTGPMHQHLEGHKELTCDKEVLTLPEADDIFVPLVNGRASCKPLVQAGDEVKAGQKIGEPENAFWYVPVFAPVSGTVVGVEKRMSSSLKPVEHLHIKNDHKDTTVRAFAEFDWEKASREELLEFVKQAGIAGLGGAGFPAFNKYAKTDGIDLLMINGVECEPYLTADLANVRANLDLLKTGTLALRKLAGGAATKFCIKSHWTKDIEALKKLFAGTGVEVAEVPDIYPMGWERTLVYQMTGKRYDKLPAEAGCILNNASTAIALGNALVNGAPITHKMVTVSGDAVKEPQNVYAVIGTPAAELVKACGGYTKEDGLIIAGGPMMGTTIPNDQFVVGLTTNGLTILENKKLDEVKCLRCGKCTEVCPSGLEPVRINFAEKTKDVETLKKLDINSCILCGLCSWVCPSKLGVTEGVSRAKRYMALVTKK
jgi:electron transport complex protein RnfC